ncbi:MAG: DEAD/DEAH box helicase [Polyangiales bacterium]
MELRAYQERGIATVEAKWAAGARSVLAVAPTGAGKGTMATAMLRKAEARGKRCLLLVHRREIVRDLRDRVTSMGVRVGTILPGEPRDASALVQVASVQSLLQTAPGGAFDLVVVDEAHHYAAEEWGAVVARIGAARIVGFTATPQRADGKPLGDMFDALVDVVSYSELLSSGIIVPCRVLRPEVPLDGDIAQSPADAYLRYARGTSAFVYVTSAPHAVTTCRLLNEAGVSAEIVSHKTPGPERAATVERLSRGELDVIVNIYTMTEGIDIPRVRTIVLARPCRHASTYIQIVGRALRRHADKDHALLLDLTGTSFDHGLPVTDRTYALEGPTPIMVAGGDVATLKARAHVKTPVALELDLVEASEETQAMFGRRVIDWATQPLGRAPDQIIARALGISRRTVSAAREQRGIAPFMPASSRVVDWNAQPLGQVPDAQLARTLGVKPSYVVAARKRRNIPVLVVNPVDWDSQPLGRVPDGELAEKLGVDKRAVARARRKKGLAAMEPTIDWDAEPLLGQVPDAELALKHGVSRGTVHSARVARGITLSTAHAARAATSTSPATTSAGEPRVDRRQATFDFAEEGESVSSP